jgi:hypothetical protein
LLTKFLKFCNPIIKSESVPPGHVKGYIYGCGGGGGWCKEVEEEVYKVVDGYEANAMMIMVIEVTNGH